MGTGSPPQNWASLMAEMMVSDFARAMTFWTGPMGFSVAFDRPVTFALGQIEIAEKVYVTFELNK